MAKPKRGLTALDVLAILGIAALVVVLILPRLSGLKMDHNERDAVHALSVLHGRLTELRNDRRGVDPAAAVPLSRIIQTQGDQRTPLDDCTILKAENGEEILVRHGYFFRIDYDDQALTYENGRPFSICAAPQRYGETGSLAFEVTHERELRRSRNLSRRYDSTNPPPRFAGYPMRRDVDTKPSASYDAQDGTPWEKIDWPADR